MKALRIAIPLMMVGPLLAAILLTVFGTDKYNIAMLYTGLALVGFYALRRRDISRIFDKIIARVTPQVEPAKLEELLDEMKLEAAQRLLDAGTPARRQIKLQVRMSDRFTPYGAPIQTKVVLAEDVDGGWRETKATKEIAPDLQKRLKGLMEAGGTQALALEYLIDDSGDRVTRFFRISEFPKILPRPAPVKTP